MMAGDINTFIGNDFIGTSSLEMVSPGQGFEVPLGADETFQVNRRLESKRVARGTLARVTYVYVTRIENFRKTAVELTLFDQIPVAQDSDIEVEMRRETTPPTWKGSNGTLRWDLSLDAGESREIRLEYRVLYPANKAIGGLE